MANNDVPLFSLEDENFRNETLTREQINNINTFVFKDLDHENINSNHCIICQENFHQEDKVSALSCRHIFHQECVENWLLNYNSVCPICRREVERD